MNGSKSLLPESKENLVDDNASPVLVDRQAIAAPNRDKLAQHNHGPSLIYLLVPAVFLLVTFLGGLRLGAADNAFIFLKPQLICLVLAAMTLVLFVRSGLIVIETWFGEHRTILDNAASAAVLSTVFAGSVQLFNSLLPEAGIPFWVVGFCFLWTIWNNLFSGFDPRKLIKSLVALFALAFAVKYLLLANLTAAPSGGWLQSIIANPGQELITWLLDLPRYAVGTGYIQFFTLGLYLLGLLLIPRTVSPDRFVITEKPANARAL